VIETPVGDKHVSAAMRDGGYVLGGEQSGHIIMLEHSTTGDGVLTSLQLLAAVNRHGVPMAAAAKMMPKYPQVLVNVPGDASRLGPRTDAAIRRAEAELGGDGRVLAGRGDNGGDALYAGALLARRGAAVTAIAAGSTVHPGGAAALREAGGRVSSPADVGYADAVPAAHPIASADLIVDGLLGIGGRGGLREPFAGLAAEAETARQAGATVVAVDLPSGIDADSGAVEGPAVR